MPVVLPLLLLWFSLLTTAQGEESPVAPQRPLVAAVLKDFPPLYHLDVHEHPEGFAIDLLQQVAQQARLEIRYLPVKGWAEAMEAVRQGQADLIPGIGLSSDRSEEFLFSVPMESIPVSWFVRRDQPRFDSLDALAGQPIGVITQSAAYSALAGNPQLRLRRMETLEQGLFSLLAGEIAAFVAPQAVLLHKARMVGVEERLRIIGAPLMELTRGYLFRRDHAKLKAQLEPILRQQTESAGYHNLYLKWYGRPASFWNTQRVLLLLALLGALGLLAFLLYQRRENSRLEQRVVERTAELSAANRELDAFTYAVSHDLRAPLRALRGFSKALQEDAGPQLQGEPTLYLQQIELACLKMSELIEALLTLSRSSRGKLQRDWVDLSQLAQQQLAELAQLEPHRPHRFEIEDGLRVWGDEPMLQVVLNNLLGNAWKYSSQQPEIWIGLYRLDRQGEDWICVADRGAGFDMKQVDKLFTPFQRLHRQDEFPGIGIGLATVQRIIRRHGGEITAHSEPGNGARFCFCLAANSAAYGQNPLA